MALNTPVDNATLEVVVVYHPKHKRPQGLGCGIAGNMVPSLQCTGVRREH